MQTIDHHEYDIEKETAASRQMLEERIPARLNDIYRVLVKNLQGFEPWRLALAVDLVQSIERNCGELLETIGNDRLPAAAWIARNLLELWVWVKYCGVSRESAWKFHEDALRDAKGLTELHKQICDAMGIEDESSTIAAQLIADVASEKLGLEDINSNFLAVAKASKTPGVDLGSQFVALNKSLSKFAHPTAGLVHGITHQPEICRHLQAICTTQGVYFAAQSTLAVEAQIGIANED
ncbi:MAG: hypothetical protein IH605_01025 [Burkholderiales bacterium]|nr:hypothetical protein [Burkholderiales bacterium]